MEKKMSVSKKTRIGKEEKRYQGKPVVLAIVLAIVLACACSKNYKEIPGAGHIAVTITPIEIVGSRTIEEALTVIGYHPPLDELYLLLFPEDGTHFLGIFDITAGKMKKKIPLRRGGFQSPTDCYSPRHMQFVNGRYFLVDQWDKILVFDKDFNHLFSSMFHQFRYFIDFFNHQDRTCFLFGKTKYTGDEKYLGCRFQVYELPERKKPRHIETLHESPMNKTVGCLNTKEEKKKYYQGELFPHHYGFAKNGKLYWSDVTKNQYFIHDPGKGETARVPLLYLKKKRFTKKDAVKAGSYMNRYNEKDFFKKFGKKFVYLPYPEDQYYFGLYDIGSDKIGIVGAVDLDRVEIRLDIFDTGHRYIESVRLPVGKPFLKSLEDFAFEGFKTYIDIDKGVLIQSAIREDDGNLFVRITTFRRK